MPITPLDNDTGGTFNQGYAKFKTPFFKISVKNPKSGQTVDLPPQILRLVQKIEINENYVSELCSIENFTITFTEGSREPFSNAAGTDVSDLYQSTLSNHTGMLTDLKFTGLNNSSTAAISALTNIDAAQFTNASNILGSDSSSSLDFVNDPTYLFQEGNIVTITWGYREFDKIRIIANPILLVQSDFPQQGQPTVIVSCLSPVALLDQITTPVGKNYKTATFGSIDELGVPVPDWTDISTVVLLQTFCAKHGITPIISSNIINAFEDKTAQKIWYAGESLIEFIKKLAIKANCIFRFYIDPNNNYKYVLEFINNTDLQSKSNIPDDLGALLTYKGQYSILKSVSIKVDFSGVINTMHTTIDSNGDQQSAVSGNGKDQVVEFSNYHVGSAPESKSDVASSIIDNEANSSGVEADFGVNKVNINPLGEDPLRLNDHTLASFARCGNRQISVEFESLGYPLLMAGEVVIFNNIGERYLTPFYILHISHILDQNGYNCHGTCMGINIGGVVGNIPSGAIKSQEPPPGLETVKEFGSLDSFGNISTPTDLVTQSRNNRFQVS